MCYFTMYFVCQALTNSSRGILHIAIITVREYARTGKYFSAELHVELITGIKIHL